MHSDLWRGCYKHKDGSVFNSSCFIRANIVEYRKAGQEGSYRKTALQRDPRMEDRRADSNGGRVVLQWWVRHRADGRIPWRA